MPDYKKMYFALAAKIAEIADIADEALISGEDMFLAEEDEPEEDAELTELDE